MASAATATSRKRSRAGRMIFIGIGLLVIVGLVGAAVLTLSNTRQATPGLPTGWQVVTAQPGTIASTVSATGNVEPLAQAELRFEVSGTITEILVQPGDTVELGQPLARIDATDLQLRVEQATADLKQAQADYADLLDGASEQEIAEARARVAQAQAQYQQTNSSVSAADIAAARATLEQARARLARLESGVATDELANSNEAVQRAQANLDQARINLSAAKERARLDMEARANAVRNTQAEYSRIYWDNKQRAEQLAQFGQSLPQAAIDQEASALRAVEDAEAALETARVAYEQARQDEINTLKVREAEVQSALAARDKLLAGPRAEDLADARAQVQRAQASLNQLIGANRSSALAAQQSNVELAQIGLDRLLADPSTSALANREAAVVRAEVALKQAQRNLELATLTSPLNAVVANVDMQVGEAAGQTTTITLVDLSRFHIDVPIDELDVAQIESGQRANISLDALPAAEITGTVANIAPLAQRSDQGTTSYEATVDIDASSAAAVRPGMTAVVQIVTQQKDNALLVPRRAVQSENGKSYVLIPQDGPADPRSNQPPSERREVTLGLSNSESVEITSGLQPGERVLVQDVVSTLGPPQN